MHVSADIVRFVHENPFLVVGVTAVAVSAVIYHWMTKPGRAKMNIDLNQQSIDIGDGVHCSPLVRDPFSEEHLIPGVRTLYEGFHRGAKLSGNGNCLGRRRGPGLPYEWLTYPEVVRRVHQFGSGLLHLGLGSNEEKFLGIYSGNRVEWTVAEYACYTYSMVVVPLYDTLGPNASAFIINQANLSIIVCDTVEKARSLLEKVDQIPSLKQIITMDDMPETFVSEAKANGISVMSFTETKILGANNPREPIPPKPSDLATICYTSGTTGDPKGVMLTHFNIVADVSCFIVFKLLGVEISTEDLHISYLPLAHMLERTVQTLMHGAQIGFYGGDIKRLVDDMQELKPTILITVPRLLNRIYDKVISGAKESRLKYFVFNMALKWKEAELKRQIVRRDSIWDKLVLRKVQNILGGRVRCIFIGSAPISPAVLQFLRCSLGCYIQEGYGQTEANAPITLTVPGDYEAGHVGGPLPCNILKLKDVPEMDYCAAEGKGEICVKGPNVFLGYYKNPELTAEVFDEEGWLHTGDIGTWLPNGTLKIIDRRKNIFKLAQGEYLSPIKIETIYGRSQFVAQVFVYGNSLQPYPLAVLVPDPDVLIPWAKEKGFEEDVTKLCQNEEVKNLILNDISTVGKARGLKSYEQAKDIILHPEPFSVENGLLTPTFKNKRPVLTKLFNGDLEKLYAKHTPS